MEQENQGSEEDWLGKLCEPNHRERAREFDPIIEK
jgi:hypothetical protein